MEEIMSLVRKAQFLANVTGEPYAIQNKRGLQIVNLLRADEQFVLEIIAPVTDKYLEHF